MQARFPTVVSRPGWQWVYPSVDWSCTARKTGSFGNFSPEKLSFNFYFTMIRRPPSTKDIGSFTGRPEYRPLPILGDPAIYFGLP